MQPLPLMEEVAFWFSVCRSPSVFYSPFRYKVDIF